MKYRWLTRIVAPIVLLSGHAQAATVIDLHTEQGSTTRDSLIEVDGDRARIVLGADGPADEIQFDAAAGIMYTVDHGKQSYSELSEASLEQISESMRAMVKQLAAQIESENSSLSEEQKAHLREALKSINLEESPEASDTKPTPQFVLADDQTEVNGIACRQGTITVDSVNQSTVCIAAQSDLGMTEAEYNTLRALIQFGIKTISELSAFGPASGFALEHFDIADFDGIPVEFRESSHRIEVTGVVQKPIEPISIPDNYTKQVAPLLAQ